MEMIFQNVLPPQVTIQKNKDAGAGPKAQSGENGQSKFSMAMSTVQEQNGGEDADAAQTGGVSTDPMQENGTPDERMEEIFSVLGIASEQVFQLFLQGKTEDPKQPAQAGIQIVEGQKAAPGAVEEAGSMLPAGMPQDLKTADTPAAQKGAVEGSVKDFPEGAVKVPMEGAVKAPMEGLAEGAVEAPVEGAVKEQFQMQEGGAFSPQETEPAEKGGYAEIHADAGERAPVSRQERPAAGEKEEAPPGIKPAKQEKAGELSDLKEHQATSQMAASRIWEGERPAGTQAAPVERKGEAPVQHFTWNADKIQENVERLSKITEQMRADRQQSLELQLEPAKLGKITIQATYKSGKASVLISCESERTMHLLSRCAQELGGILKEHTGEQTMVFVETSQEDYTSQENGQERERQPDGRQKKKEHKAGDDFLQQLRLGILQQA